MQEELVFDHLLTGFREILALLILTKAVCGVVSLKYIVNDLNIDENIKKIMAAEAIFLFLTSTMAVIAYLLLFVADLKNSVSCGFIIDMIPITGIVNSFLAMMLAILRYYMIGKIHTSANVKTWIYDGLTFISVVFLILVILSAIFGVHASFLAAQCYVPIVRRTNLIHVFGLASVVIFFITLLNDISYLCKARKLNATSKRGVNVIISIGQRMPEHGSRNITEGNEMSSEPHYMKRTVPLTSSIVTLTNVTLVSLTYALAYLYIGEKWKFTQWVLIFGTIMNILHLPLVLLFTTNTNESEAPNDPKRDVSTSSGMTGPKPQLTPALTISNPTDHETKVEKFKDGNDQGNERFGEFFDGKQHNRKSIVSVVSLSPVDILQIHLSIEDRLPNGCPASPLNGKRNMKDEENGNIQKGNQSQLPILAGFE